MGAHEVRINVRVTPGGLWHRREGGRPLVQDVHGFNFEKETDENALRLRGFLTDTRCVCAGRPLPLVSSLTVTSGDTSAGTKTPPDTQLKTKSMKLSSVSPDGLRARGHSGDPPPGQLRAFMSDGFWGVIAPPRGWGDGAVWGLNRDQRRRFLG